MFRLFKLLLNPLAFLVLTALPIAFLVLVTLLSPQSRQYYISQFAWNFPTEDNLQIWARSTSSSQFQNKVKDSLGNNYVQPTSDSPNDIYKWSKLVLEIAQTDNVDLEISSVGYEEDIVSNPIYFNVDLKMSKILPSGLELIKPGKMGSKIYSNKYLRYKDQNIFDEKFINTSLIKFIEPVNQIEVEGVASSEVISSEIKNLFEKSSAANEENNNLFFLEDFKNQRPQYTNVNIISQKLVENKSIVVDSKGAFDIGDLIIQYPDCQSVRKIDLYYEYFSDSVKFKNKDDVFGLDCIRFAKEIETAACSDCRFYPVDKKHRLVASYEPPVVLVPEVPGGALIHKDAYIDFLEMYEAARRDGAYINITSSYRSYHTQQYTYESWVQTEMSKGYSRAQAEINANTYSALPGHSEHQLGTTLDIYSTGNVQNVWNWLANNAHKYGFVLSYPQGKEYLTGYVYEPWHYRWIGKDLALEYKEIEPYTYLAQFLRDKKLYIRM